MAQFWEQLKFADRLNNGLKAAQKKNPPRRRGRGGRHVFPSNRGGTGFARPLAVPP
jgi:hypothetical protein